jgi:hypothetical protein
MNAAACWLSAALVVALSLSASVLGCHVVIVSPTSGSTRDESVPFGLSYRITSSAGSPCPSTAAVTLRVGSNYVQALDSPTDTFLPIALSAPALSSGDHIIELCLRNLPKSCAQTIVSIARALSSRPWAPSASGHGASGFVAHNADLAAALDKLFPSHEALLDMSCDKYYLAHRGARLSLNRDALTHMHDYSRRPLTQFSHCIAQCANPPPLPSPASTILHIAQSEFFPSSSTTSQNTTTRPHNLFLFHSRRIASVRSALALVPPHCKRFVSIIARLESRAAARCS